MSGATGAQTAWRRLVAALVVGDGLALTLAIVLATGLRAARDNNLGEEWAALTLVPLWLLVFRWQGLYQRRYLLGGPTEYERVLLACSLGVLALMGVAYFAGGLPSLSREWLFVCWALSILLVGGERFLARRVVYHLRRHGGFIQRALIAGVDRRSVAIADQFHSSASHGVAVAGFVDDFLAPGTPVAHGPEGPLLVLGPGSQAGNLAQMLHVDLLIVNSQALAAETVQRLLLGSAGAPCPYEVRLVTLPYDVLGGGVETTLLGHVPLLRLDPQRITGLDAVARRCFDVTVAAGALVVAAPVVALLCLLALLRGVHPLTDTEWVYGRGGAPLPLVLLRREATPLMLLRGWPVLFSVLLGRLSIVGPRPRRVREDEQHPFLAVVQSVEPGLTGPWRVLTADATPTVDQRVADDVWYIRNYTIWQDLYWLWQSARALLRPGAGRSALRLQRWDVSRASGERVVDAVGAANATH